ncbi:O-antigen ligase family protein [Reinekea forsetii]|uniref:O-antigen polymerase n=1 Tax=Reinekea forsetii TaxID=1336806 RepID=A0A2K8KPD5_9GAMM|nr:O-antigen ligase family protein [Reinekea forsetii]ATX76633.1 O-antigen polymerase [Reinekea forsetii]
MTQHALAITDINRWFPSTYHRGPNWMVWLALMACFCTVFIKIWTPTSVNRWPEAVTTLLFIYPLVTNWRFFKKQPMMIFWALAIAAPFVFFGINYSIDAESAVKYGEFEKLPRIYLFIPIAWWLGGNDRTVALFLGTALIGFFFACLQDPNFNQTVARIFQGGRVDFGILNAQHVALFFSFGLIGCLSYFQDAIKNKTIIHRIGFTAFLTIAGALCTIGIIGTQTRAAFLGLLTTFVVYLMISMYRIVKIKKAKQNIKAMMSTLAAIIIIGSMSYLFKDNLTEKVFSEKNTISAITAGDWDNIPYTSIGVRVNTWLQALEWIAEKPLIGYGGKVRTDIVKQSLKHPDWVKKQFGHFHNSYIEIMLGSGLLGLFLFFTPVIYGLTKAHKLCRPIHYFALFGLINFLFMNMFESYLFFWMGPFVLTLVNSPLFSSVLSNAHIKIGFNEGMSSSNHID